MNLTEQKTEKQDNGISLVHELGWASANVIVFENREQVLKYLSDKTKNAEKFNYKPGREIYLLKNPSDTTFMWANENYVISVSDYRPKTPTHLMKEYLDKYPSDLEIRRK